MDLESPQNCLTFHLQRATRELTRQGDAALAPLGISSQQFSILTHIGNADTLPITRLAKLVGAERTTMTRNIGLLKKAGWVAEASTSDGRVRALCLTPAGQKLVDDAYPTWRDMQTAALARLSAIDPETLLIALRSI